MTFLRTFLILGRSSNLPTVWTNVMLGWLVAGGSWTPELAWILAGISLIYIGGMTLNDAFDATWDRAHAPDRPIPSGQISRVGVWILGIVETAAGAGIIVTLSSFRWEILLALLLAIFAYNWLHKKWAGSAFIMGLCRALVYLGAASAVVAHTHSFEIPVLIWVVAVGMILFIAGITFAARSERKEGKLSMPFYLRLMLLLPILFPIYAARKGMADITCYLIAGMGFILLWAWLSICRSKLATHTPKGVAWSIAAIALIDATVVVFSDWRGAVCCVMAFLLTLLAQRFIPAT